MANQVTRSSAARRDIIELADYIARGNFAAASRFLDATEETFHFLAANREVGQLCNFSREQAAGIRVWPIHGFRNHLAFYRTTIEGIEVVRVLHGARNIEALFGDAPKLPRG
jgi:toxin ParE1/3/4